ncbi:MAG TPA: gephyrin-like molybdotransferase Glp [Novosphingobium sp.]|nr:gephyrin-like molybdotransferase Glp [Novosphingobium sp.]
MTAPLPLEEAQARLLALAVPLPVERVDLDSALGRWLAKPLLARRTQPAADLSAMDGYALRADDLTGPWQVIGESAAGHPYAGGLQPGEAVRIATGALLPEDAGAVVIQEDCARDDDRLTLTGDPATAGRHIRRTGLDFSDGDVLLATSTRFGPAQLALALAGGHSHVAVHRLPRVAVIDTGDELAADPEDCAPHQVPASNGAMLAAMLRAVPCEVQRIGPVPDRRNALLAALAHARDADVIVTSGGASVGDHDLLQPALAAWGAQIDFWKVAIKPGKPLLVATCGQQLVVGLPGNPVSSYVTAFFFVLPLLRALSGAATPLPRSLPARLDGNCDAGGKRREFIRAYWDGVAVTPQTTQDSGALSSLAASNALIDRPAGAPAADHGSDVLVFPFENGGIA